MTETKINEWTHILFFDISIPLTDPNCGFLIVIKWEVAKDSGKLGLPNFMT